MKAIFPFDPLDEKSADGPFKDEYEIFKSNGIECSLFDFDALDFDELRPKPRLESGDTVLYRGWMMSPGLYGKLEQLLSKKGVTLFVSLDEFISSHHLPKWYESCKEFTAETHFYREGDDIVLEASKLGWERIFVKDFVKSNYSDRGSVAESPEEVLEILNLIREHRGELEGGICLRRYEEYIGESESRYFVFNGKVYSSKDDTPEIVESIAKIHKARFYSVDIVEDSSGRLRLVELGDGQVSDKKTWDPKVFSEMLLENLAS